jgi:hypothetical protein
MEQTDELFQSTFFITVDAKNCQNKINILLIANNGGLKFQFNFYLKVKYCVVKD